MTCIVEHHDGRFELVRYKEFMEAYESEPDSKEEDELLPEDAMALLV